ncbi:MAG: DUF4418 family protein [Treponema sp.]|nr:DUF4418 family protein [Treponema sp.]
MKQRLIFGIFFALIGLLIAIGPYTLFPVCESMGTMIMKCFWTRRAELGIGLLIAILGILTILFKSPQIRLGLGIGVFLNGALALLIPTALIGVCADPHEPCRLLTLPSLSVLSGILIALALVNGILLARRSVQ